MCVYLVSDPPYGRQRSAPSRTARVVDAGPAAGGGTATGEAGPDGDTAAAERDEMAEDETGDDLDAVVAAACGGDEVAFGRLFRAAHPGVLRYLYVMVGSEAEDVASETWLQVARDLRGFSGGWDGFRGWTVTIARHRAIDHIRKQRRRSEVAVPVEQFTTLPAFDDTAGEAVDAVSTDLAISLIARLPREQAEAVMLRVVIGLDSKTSGEILGRRPGAVRTAAHRGLRQLDRFFGHDLDRFFGRDTDHDHDQDQDRSDSAAHIQ